ncbi:excalibur calcium-binding domain-containing protein [Salinicoccus kekensis]|uniref:excalibur calcium-binding domain-containing protein n=1 Tax=Salinicoccus kekensis TaxID=714307 RepID=UPI0015CCB703|nr:excalibur calcium-binding domain-containing protein [Salinicoccus kekensis]
MSSTVGIADIFTGILLMATAGLVLSLLFNRNYKNKYNERGKFNRTTGITLGLMVLSFVVIGLSADPEGTEEHLDSGEIAVEAGIDEMTEEEDAEETEAEQRAEEEQAAEKAEAEKQAEEEQAAEKAEAEKQAEEEQAAEKAEAEKQAEEEQAAEETEAEKQAEEEQAAEETEAEKQTEEEDVVKNGLIPVQLYRVVDGDTVHVIDEDGNNLNLRLLLIDTPETVHPNEPVQPYGPEASERLTDLLNGAGQLYIEYDDGDKQDHYGRELVYLYADDVNVHEVLLEEGLARVGYIYEQQRYLEDFKVAEQYAKDNGLGIWSIPGYVNEGGEGFNYEEEPAVEEPADDGGGTDTGSYNFANCTELREVFPDGVASDHPAYQSKMDRDNDGYACEISSSSSAETSIEEPADTSADTGNYNFANCTELREVFPDGVPSDHPAYQSKMDRDNDGHACE